MYMWISYLASLLTNTTQLLIAQQRHLRLAEVVLGRVESKRESELQHLLRTLLLPKLPFWPRGVRGGGQVKQASVRVPLSPHQWQILVSGTPTHTSTTAITERAVLLRPHNRLQASLFALRRVRRDQGYCTVESLSLVFNHRTKLLHLTVRGESYNKFG
jgi:hypothetical protein